MVQFFPEIKSRLLKLLVSILIIRLVVGSNNYPQNHQILVGDWGFNSWQGKGILFFLNVCVSRGACSTPYSMDTGAQSSGVKRRNMKLITCLRSRLRVSGAVPVYLHMPAWCAQGQLYVYLKDISFDGLLK